MSSHLERPDLYLKGGSEEIDDFADRAHQLGQRWNDRLTLKNLRLTERYIEGELKLIVWFTILPWGAGQFCAIFQRERCLGRVEGDPVIGCITCKLPISLGDIGIIDETRSMHRSDVNCELSSSTGDREENSVLVDNIEVVQGPDHLVVPSLVRLQRAEFLDEVLPRSVYFALNKGFHIIGVPSPRIAKDREHRLSRDWSVAYLPNQPTGEMVERAPKVVDRISNQDGELNGRHRSRPLFSQYPSDPVGVLRIVVDLDSVRVRLDEGTDNRVKVDDVAFGPFDLPLNSDERISHRSRGPS